MGAYTAEDYIVFIESGRIDKVSRSGLELIADRFRELESNEFRGPGDQVGTYSLVDTNLNLILVNPGTSKIMTVKYLKTYLGLTVVEAVNMIKYAPSILLKNVNPDKESPDYRFMIDVKDKFKEINCELILQ